eukprot:10384468-Heterocapsa_arctica.AAC.1
MGGGAALQAKLEVRISTKDSVQHTPTRDGKTLTAIITIRTVMTITRDTKPGWEHITEWWRTTKTTFSNKGKKLRLAETKTNRKMDHG